MSAPTITCHNCMDTGTTGWHQLCTCGILGPTYAIRARKTGTWLRQGNIGFTRQMAAIKWAKDYANDYQVIVTIHQGTEGPAIVTIIPD